MRRDHDAPDEEFSIEELLLLAHLSQSVARANRIWFLREELASLHEDDPLRNELLTELERVEREDRLAQQ